MNKFKEECYGCKFYTKQLNVDYVPTQYCKKNIQDKEHCEHYKEPYTVSDYLSDISFDLMFLVLIALGVIFMTFMDKVWG